MLDGLPSLTVGGLDAAAAGKLLIAVTDGTLNGPDLGRLVAATHGNPDIRSVERALRSGDLTLADLSQAEDVGLVSVGLAGLSFYHPACPLRRDILGAA